MAGKKKGRPRLGDQVRRQTSVAIEPEMRVFLDQQAEREGLSRSQLITDIIAQWRELHDERSGPCGDDGEEHEEVA